MIRPLCWGMALLCALATTVDAELLRRPITAAQLQTNTVQAVQHNNWSQYLEFLDKTCLDTFPLLPKLQSSMRYKALVEDKVIGLALAQAAFLRATTLPVLEAITNEPPTNPDSYSSNYEVLLPPSQQFLVWFLSDQAKVEEFCEMLKPQDDVAQVFRRWFQFWNEETPTVRNKYWRVALACALVFQRPINYQGGLVPSGTVNPKERYQFYRDAMETAKLPSSIAEMTTWELIWVVDAPVPTSELEWARVNTRWPRPEWGKAYSSIRYRMEKAMLSKSLYKNYTLAEIRQQGGVCADQAYFAAMTAKANGIPAMIITGVGDRGPHAWFGYKATTQNWNLRTGRYADNFPAGSTIDPQTRQPIKEPTLELLTDPQRRQPSWKTSTRLVWLADLLDKQGRNKEAQEALESAVADSPRHFGAWQTLCNFWKRNAPPLAKMQDQFRVLRTTFSRYPDTLASINQWELDFMKSSTNTTAMLEVQKRQYRDLKNREGDRTDLLIDNIIKQAELLVTAGKIDDADRVYRKAFQDPGHTINWFQTLFPSYIEFARANKRIPEAARFVYSELRRLPRPDSDPFAQKTYAQVQRDVAAVLEEAGRTSLAKSLRSDATQLEKQANSNAYR